MHVATPNSDGSVTIHTANLDAAFAYLQAKHKLAQPPTSVSAQELAQYIVSTLPKGTPWQTIKPSEAALQDRSLRDAWELDFSEPAGSKAAVKINLEKAKSMTRAALENAQLALNLAALRAIDDKTVLDIDGHKALIRAAHAQVEGAATVEALHECCAAADCACDFIKKRKP